MRNRQQVSQQISSLFARIEALRLKLDLKWEELAERMDVHRSLFFQVKRGNCGFSARNLLKLETLEKEVGIAVTAPVSPVTVILETFAVKNASDANVLLQRISETISEMETGLTGLQTGLASVKDMHAALKETLSRPAGTSGLGELTTLPDRSKKNVNYKASTSKNFIVLDEQQAANSAGVSGAKAGAKRAEELAERERLKQKP
jgi:transcriptional regulator with XRE-family HTH domain